MKYYTIERAYTGYSKIRVFKENGVEAYYTIQNDCNVEDYCNYLEGLGCVSESFLKSEQQARNFRDGLADSFGRY